MRRKEKITRKKIARKNWSEGSKKGRREGRKKGRKKEMKEGRR